MEDRPEPPAAINPPPPTGIPDDSQQSANVKETIESILVAFILAFIFRCFVVEAFVIPTGSMAPTLLGAHTRYDCPDCGYHFDVNFSANSKDDTEIPDHAGYIVTERDSRDPDNSEKTRTRQVDEVYSDIRCPNCGYRFPPATNPSVLYGDRILVLKYAYLLEKPQRWDVVVFKSPVDPAATDYSVNYIKRLTGRPGETVMVLDGDVYVKARGQSEFKVQTKTRAAQESLWRIIYDDDFRPASLQPRKTPWKQPWQSAGGSGWSSAPSSGHHAFEFKSLTSSGVLTFNARASDEGNTGFIDWLAYDQRHYLGDRNNYYEGQFPVSDLKLDLVYDRAAGTGPLKLTLTKLDERFTAEISPEGVRLVHESPNKPAAVKSAPFAFSGPAHLEFMNVDYRVALRVNGQELIATTAEEYHPDIQDLMQRISDLHQYDPPERRAKSHNPPLPPPSVTITADKQECELTHVSLWRDVYYIGRNERDGGGGVRWGAAGDSIATPQSAGPIQLGDDEYFVMGDNSPLSSDARFWKQPIHLPNENLDVEAGRVPGRFLLGKAFFVYWPAGYKPTERAPGIIPNFGQMRFIQ